MLFLLSPAKSLDYEAPGPKVQPTDPLFVQQSAKLIQILRRQSVQEIATLMALSDKLAALNVARYQAWSPQADDHNARPAVLAFDGDVYDGLGARQLRPADLKWAQAHVCILSGLYGVLRPLDRMQPYRLEMGTALANPRGSNLVQFWGPRIADYLNERQAEAPAPAVVVNLASQEYFRAVDRKVLRATVVDCVFEERRGNTYQVISFFAKRARGLMARYAVQQRVRSVEKLKLFDAAGYRFDAAASSAQRLVFRRETPQPDRAGGPRT